MEPAGPVVIVQNFGKGLLMVRSAAEPVPAEPVASVATIVRTKARPPEFALLPSAMAPRNGVLLSILLHSAATAVVVSVPILFPAWAMTKTRVALDVDYEVEYQPLSLPILPAIAEGSADAKIEHGSGPKAQRMAEALPTGARPTANRPKPDYAGPQLIISNPPDSTASVQTIRRPDLVVPSKMTYPLRLPSMVILPHRTIRAPVAPQFEQPPPSNPDSLLTLRPNDPPVPAPTLPMDKPKLSLTSAKPVLPKTKVTSEPTLPVLTVNAGQGITAPKALVVINAVTVPPEPDPVIPERELSSRFVVGPSREATSVAGTSPEATRRNLASVSPSNVGQNLPHASVENGTGTRVEAGDGHSGMARTESSSSIGPRLESGAGTAPAVVAGNKSLPGISISGGAPGRSGRAGATSLIPHGSYALTIISGGNSGGASRDLGVFSRSDTVYTVYIPMTEAGGGPDWPMQYALVSTSPAHSGLPSGLLTPPVVLKKNRATAPKAALAANSGPVFVTGIIDENGKLGNLRAIRAVDSRTQSALNGFAQWEFLAAQLDGKPVGCKVLIGVSVMPAEEVGK